MAIEPIKGFYVHDEETDTDGVAVYGGNSLDLNMFDYPATYHSKKFVNKSNGELIDANAYVSSDYVPVLEGHTYKISTRANNDSSGYALYDENYNYLLGGSLYVTDGNGTIFGDTIVKIPRGAKYLRYCCTLSISPQAKITGLDPTKDVGAYFNTYEELNDYIPKPIRWTPRPNAPYWVLHVDCARKYFSINNIKLIIDLMEVNKLNQLNFHFSEDIGFRLELDNMVFNIDGTSYDLAQCLGGSENPTKWYTQSEMDTLIQYARNKGIDIVPSFDMPAHMDRILRSFPSFKYNGSGTLDFTNATAVKFGLAIAERYAKYFASRGCSYYNIGCDEIGGGWDALVTDGHYPEFLSFINSIVDMLNTYGLIPRGFNDGNMWGDDFEHMFNKNITMYQWKISGENIALPNTTQQAGFDIINSSSGFYWILGGGQVTPAFLSARDLLRDYAGSDRQYEHPVNGAMVSVWCDSASTINPGDNGDAIVTAITPVINAYGVAIKKTKTKYGIV